MRAKKREEKGRKRRNKANAFKKRNVRFGCKVVIPRVQNPFPMVAPNDGFVKKNNHVIGFRGGTVWSGTKSAA